MTRTGSLITFFISLAIMLSSCGKPAPGYKIYRIDDALLVFLAMNDSSEISDVAIKDRVLYVDIDTAGQIEKRVTSLEKKLLSPVDAHETLKISGTDRINGYGVVHLTITSPTPNLRNFASFHWSGWQLKIHPKKPGPFKNSGAFRIGDRIIAYALLQPTQFDSVIGIHHGKTAIDENGNQCLIAQTAVGKERILTFFLKDVAPPETVQLEYQEKLGDDMYIVHWGVAPKVNRGIKNKDVVSTDR